MNIPFNPIFKVTDHTDYVGENTIFFAFNGKNYNGIEFIILAISKGSRIIYLDINNNNILKSENYKNINNKINENNVSLIFSNQMEIDFVLQCQKAYDNPQDKIKLIGITGTKGKTSTSVILHNMLNIAGYKTGLISSAYNLIEYEKQINSKLYTTPKADFIYAFLDTCVKNNLEYCVIEASAQAYSLKRIYGINFDVTIGTNISREHGEFYPNIKDYYQAKYDLLLNNTKENGLIILNNEDKLLSKIKIKLKKNNEKKLKILTFGENSFSDLIYKIKNENYFETEAELVFNNHKFELILPFIGKHSIENGVGAFLAFQFLISNNNKEYQKILFNLKYIKSIPGRMQSYKINNSTVFIDIAHNPSSFESVLSSLKKIDNNKNLIIVFGAGGDKDKKKRPIMGTIAEKYCDEIYLTSDNSRNELPENIIKDIIKGLRFNKKIKIILDREEAIIESIKNDKKDSVIIILGKGAEDYIEINNQKIPYSDEEVIKKIRIN